MKRSTMGLIILACLFALVIPSCKQPANEDEATLGDIDFDVTSSKDAVESFEQGVLLLHSFMYADAAFAFKKAQEIDTDFAMAYWGEAMTYNHPLWSEQDYEKGVEVLARLGATSEERMAKAPTAFEKDLLKAVEVLYGEGTKIDRDDAYAAHLATLSKKYPGNHEVAAFYALSLLGSVESGRDYDVYEKGATIAKGILKENPQHPGALHYLIHSYDDPDHASLALEAANSYSKVAPDAGHALHMPSHIYIAMGMWDEVIASNIRSYEARLKKGGNNWNLHAYHWLLYGYLQTGNSDKVDEIMSRMGSYAEERGGSNYTKSYLIEMVGNYYAETGNWNAPAPTFQFETEGLNLRFVAGKLFIEGYQAYQQGEPEKLRAALSQLEEKIAKAQSTFVTSGVTVCSGVGFASKPADQGDIDVARVLATQLSASLAQLDKKDDREVEKLLVLATELENQASFVFGPPSIVLPTYEMYGNWLLGQDRFEEAMAQFEKSLEKGPGRRKALMGKLQAAKGLGDQSTIEEVEGLIDRITTKNT